MATERVHYTDGQEVVWIPSKQKQVFLPGLNYLILTIQEWYQDIRDDWDHKRPRLTHLRTLDGARTLLFTSYCPLHGRLHQQQRWGVTSYDNGGTWIFCFHKDDPSRSQTRRRLEGYTVAWLDELPTPTHYPLPRGLYLTPEA